MAQKETKQIFSRNGNGNETKRKYFFWKQKQNETETKRKREKIPEFQYPAYEGPQDHVFSLLKNQILRFSQFL
jgi:hypothetical protein